MARKTVPRSKPDRVATHRGRENPQGNSVDPPPREGNRGKRPDRRRGRQEVPQYAYIAFAAGSILVGLMGIVSYAWYNHLVLDVIRTPLNAPQMVNVSASLEVPSRYWGSYRSGLYFGMKTRTPHSPVVGKCVRRGKCYINSSLSRRTHEANRFNDNRF